MQRASGFVGPLHSDFCDIRVLLLIAMDIKLSLAINTYPRTFIMTMSRKECCQIEPFVSHNMRQVFDLVDRIVVFRRGRIVANLDVKDTDGQDVVAYITGAKTGAEFEGAA